MPVTCSAPRCSNSSDAGYGFKVIPPEGPLRALWLTASGCAEWNPCKGGRLCEVHFDPSTLYALGQRKYIKADAVPSTFCTCPIPPDKLKSAARRPLGQLQPCDANNRRKPDHTYASVPHCVQATESDESARPAKVRKQDHSFSSSSRSNDENDSPAESGSVARKRWRKFNHAADCIVRTLPIPRASLPPPPPTTMLCPPPPSLPSPPPPTTPCPLPPSLSSPPTLCPSRSTVCPTPLSLPSPRPTTLCPYPPSLSSPPTTTLCTSPPSLSSPPTTTLRPLPPSLSSTPTLCPSPSTMCPTPLSSSPRPTTLCPSPPSLSSPPTTTLCTSPPSLSSPPTTTLRPPPPSLSSTPTLCPSPSTMCPTLLSSSPRPTTLCPPPPSLSSPPTTTLRPPTPSLSSPPTLCPSPSTLSSTPRCPSSPSPSTTSASTPLATQAESRRRGRQPKSRNFSAGIESLRKEIADQHKMITSLRRERVELKKEINTQSKILDSTLGKDQQKAVERGTTRGSPWSDETVKKGLQLRLTCGTTGYKSLIKTGIPLPSVRTLQENIQHVEFNPGVLHFIFDHLEIAVPTLHPRDRRCALVFDEMAIKKGLELDRSTGAYIGSVTLRGGEGQLASKAVGAQLVGLGKRWKEWVGYHFTPPGCLNEAMKDFLCEILQRSFHVGLVVLTLVCDMGNRGVLAKMGFRTKKDDMVFVIPNPFNLEKPLFVQADPLHVFKNFKIMSIEHQRIKLPADIVIAYSLPTDVVNFAYVEWMDDFQERECQQLKYALKLNKSDIHPNHFRKMKVVSATNVINEGTAAGLYQLVIEEELPLEAQTTAWFVKLLVRWFKLMTNRTLQLALSLKDKGKYDEAIGTLQLSSDVCRRMVVGDGSWKPAQTHFILCTESMLGLQDQLLNKEGFDHFRTANATQDTVESGYSNVRRGQPKPTALDFKFRLRQLCVIGQDAEVSNASYDTSQSVPSLLDLILAKKAKKKTVLAEAPTEENPLDLSTPDACPELTRHFHFVVYRMAGYILHVFKKSFKCAECYQRLQAPEDSDNPFAQFVDLTDFSPGASSEVYELLSAVERVMWAAQSLVISMGEGLCEKFIVHFERVLADYSLGTCHPTKKKLVARYVKMRLPQMSKTLTRNLVSDVHGDAAFGSRTMGGELLTERYAPRARGNTRTAS